MTLTVDQVLHMIAKLPHDIDNIEVSNHRVDFDYDLRRYCVPERSRCIRQKNIALCLTAREATVELRKILLRWIVLNDAGQEIIWTDDEAEAEDLRQRIERLTKPLNKPLTKLLTKQVTKPLTKIKHVAQEEIHPRQAYGQIPKWRAKEIAEKKKG